jgi:hypothetical protein
LGGENVFKHIVTFGRHSLLCGECALKDYKGKTINPRHQAVFAWPKGVVDAQIKLDIVDLDERKSRNS